MNRRNKCNGLMEDAPNYWINGKRVNLQWLQYPNQINGDNLNIAKLETSGYFRNKKEAIFEIQH
jgi:hypothetical protein